MLASRALTVLADTAGTCGTVGVGIGPRGAAPVFRSWWRWWWGAGAGDAGVAVLVCRALGIRCNTALSGLAVALCVRKRQPAKVLGRGWDALGRNACITVRLVMNKRLAAGIADVAAPGLGGIAAIAARDGGAAATRIAKAGNHVGLVELHQGRKPKADWGVLQGHG